MRGLLLEKEIEQTDQKSGEKKCGIYVNGRRLESAESWLF